MIVDSHCHLIHEKNTLSVEKIIQKAKKNDVTTLLNITTKQDEFVRSIQLTEKYNAIYTSIGIHPHDSSQMNQKVFNKILELCNHEKVIGIGETGLDYYYNNSLREEQINSFKMHIDIAQRNNLPLIIHMRNAEDDMLEIIRKKYEENPFLGLIHCFTGSNNFLQKLLPLGFYFSISGVITFKNSNDLRETVKNVPLDRLLIETDSPYLTPVPHRGKTNDPSYIIHTLEYLAKLFNLKPHEIQSATTNNFKNLFVKSKI